MQFQNKDKPQEWRNPSDSINGQTASATWFLKNWNPNRSYLFTGVCFQDRVSELPAGPQPPFFQKLFNLMPAAPVDRKPVNSSFGDVLQQVYPVYRQVGHDILLCSTVCSAASCRAAAPNSFPLSVWTVFHSCYADDTSLFHVNIHQLKRLNVFFRAMLSPSRS